MRPLIRLASMGLAVLAVVCARTVTATPRDAVIHAARCRVRCLSLLSLKRPRMDMVSAFTGIKMGRWPTFAQCIDVSNCTACLRPCSQPFVNLNLCQSVCESDIESCQQSCSYLKDISMTRSGRCPADNEATNTGTVAPCVENCRIDLDCRHEDKCCRASCGKTCHRPTHRFEGVPSVPESPHIRERPKGGILEVKWTGASNNFTLPVVYIIESRWTVGARHSETPFTHWQQISQTTTNSAIVHDATPGHWYQFRVSAVSMNGCRGPSTEMEPFKLSREPRLPGSPRNLTEGDTIITNRQMSVTIHWRAPRRSDLPISKYKLFWSAQMKDELSSQSLSGPLQEHRKVLKGNVHKYELPDLLPDTTYFIQVQAICKYGDSKLKSSRSNMYIQTAQPWHEELEPTPVVVVLPLPPPAPLRSLTVHNPFFQNGLLKTNVTWKRPLALHTGEAPVDRVVVQWKPHACISGGRPDKDGRSTTLGPNTLTATMSATTRESFYIVYDLRFDCRLYMVRVWPVSVDGVRGAQANVTFPMTECKDIKVLGDISPDCPTRTPQGPAKPPHLEHSFVSNGANMSVRLSWHTPHSDTPITDYRVEWGKLGEGEGKPLPENTLTKVLPKEVHSFSIEGLVGGVEYLVRVQALIITAPKKVISGRVATLHFTTPILTARHRDPPYQHSNVAVAQQPDAMNPPSLHSVRSSGADNSGASQLHVKPSLISLVSLAVTTNILFCCHYVNARPL